MSKIKIKEVVLGTHCWENCPHEEVKFLRNEHHHDFQIFVEAEVDHDDRDIEFIKLRIWLKKYIKANYNIEHEIIRFGSRSCEMISQEITDALIKDFGDKKWKVSVSEDGTYTGGEW